MALLSIEVCHLRNLIDMSIEFSSGLNFFYGPNGSGKTNLLEAVHLLGRGKSFRTVKLAQVVQYGKQIFRVVGEVSYPPQGSLTLGLERNGKQLTCKAGGKSLRTAASLAFHLPLQFVSPHSIGLVELGPRFRRQFIDWGVFHVEYRFLPAWRRYQHTLKQRNACLKAPRNPRAQPELWNRELASAGELISAFRRHYVILLSSVLAQFTQMLLGGLEITLIYRPGWQPEGEPLIHALQRGLEGDLRAGFTRSGVHHDDIDITHAGRPVLQSLSRGQQKLLVYALYLSQAEVFRKTSERSCVFLVDDVASELDPLNRNRVFDSLAQMGQQVLFTGTERRVLPATHHPITKMFHVKHGAVHEVI